MAGTDPVSSFDDWHSKRLKTTIHLLELGDFKRHGPETGLNEQAQSPEAVTRAYQPFWALKAQLPQQLESDRQATATAFGRAIGLTEDGDHRHAA